MAKAIRAMHKIEEMLGHLIPAGGGIAVKVTADLLQVISDLVGYTGEDPDELVAAVRKATNLGAHQLTSEAEAGALRTIAGIVGYEGTDGEQLVEVVRKRVLTCASCASEDVLAEIREIVDYSPDMGDSGLADAVRRLALRDASSDCQVCVDLKGDLLMACGLDLDLGKAQDWDYVATAAIQTIAELTNRRDHLLALLTKERADNAHLYEEKINRANAAFLHTVGELKDEIARLSGQTHSESKEMTALRQDFERALREIETAYAKLTLAEQSRDEWEQRAVQAESSVETLEAELRNREDAPAAPCASTTYLLDIALKALRGEGPGANQLAALIDAARRAA